MTADPQPPARAERLMQRVLSTDNAAHGVIGDLREEYALRTRRGRRAANVWFWFQAISVFLRFRWERWGQTGERRRGPILGVLRQDVRFALRGFRRTPGFAVVAALTLAMTINKNSLMLA